MIHTLTDHTDGSHWDFQCAGMQVTVTSTDAAGIVTSRQTFNNEQARRLWVALRLGHGATWSANGELLGAD